MLYPKVWTYSLPAALLLMAPFDLLASLGMDIYLPVVVRMPAVLRTTPATIQLTLSLYMIVLGCGQLLFGPLADRIGRRPVLLGGAFLFALASAGLAMTSSAGVFIALRVLQSAGGAAALVATFATVRDVYAARPEGAIIYGLFGSMLAFVPAFAPMIGALVDHMFGWRAVFWLLAGLAALSGLHAFLRWPETCPVQTHPATLQGSFGRVFSSVTFWTYTMGFSTAMGTFFTYFSTAPRILMQALGLSSTMFSLVFATVALRLDLVVEIRLVLECIGVEIATFQRFVRLGIVIENDRLDFQAVLGRFRRHDFPDIFVLTADDADLDGLVSRLGWLWRGEAGNGDGRSH